VCNDIVPSENEKVKERIMGNSEHLRTVYRKLRRHLTLEEKIWLLDFRGNIERYKKRLLKLAQKYEIPIKKNKEK